MASHSPSLQVAEEDLLGGLIVGLLGEVLLAFQEVRGHLWQEWNT